MNAEFSSLITMVAMIFSRPMTGISDLLPLLPLIISTAATLIAFLTKACRSYGEDDHCSEGLIAGWRLWMIGSGSPAVSLHIEGTVARNNGVYIQSCTTPAFTALIKKVMLVLGGDQHAEGGDRCRYTVHEYYTGYTAPPIMFPLLKSPIMIAPGVLLKTACRTSTSTRDDSHHHGNQNKPSDVDTLSIVLTSSTIGLSKIRAFVDACIEDHNEEKRRENIVAKKVFEFKGVRSSEATWAEMPFHTTKTFDNMFFADKDRLVDRIDKFSSAEGHAEYERLGLPYTLGFLLVGEPGTGKTSFIKSLARHTNRHIVIVPAKDIRDRETLMMAFRCEHLEDYKIPFKDRLYVFEDIDCCDWRDVILSRDLRKDGPCSAKDPVAAQQSALVKAVASLVTTAKGARNRKRGDDDDDDNDTTFDDVMSNRPSITLADLLEVLDGVIEMSGRMLVMTSNRPEEIDPALLRAGRIDEVVRFGAMSADDAQRMHTLWFGKDAQEPPEGSPLERALKFGGVTQAELGALLSARASCSIG